MAAGWPLTWRARWIWSERPRIALASMTNPVLEPDVGDRVALLRRTFTLEAPVPGEVPARVWADARYVLLVNGTEVQRGPVRANPRRARYDVVDLAPHLVTGENVVAILARHFGAPTSWWMPVPPSYSLGSGAVVFEARLGDDWLVSDRSWKAGRGEAWTPVPIPGDVASLPLESFDARRHPVGWDRPGFDDRDWKPATEIQPTHTGGSGNPSPPSEPYGLLTPIERTPLGGERVGMSEVTRVVVEATPAHADPVNQVLADQQELPGGVDRSTAGAPDSAVLVRFDAGRVVAGTVQLTVEGATPGTVIDVACAEHVDDAGRLVTLGQHAGFRYVTRGEAPTERFETLDVLGTRYATAVVRPVGGTPVGAVVPTVRLAVQERLRSRPDGPFFACSDPLLERVHAVGLRTVDLCAFDAYVDCPTREQRAWTGDSVVHQMVDLTCNPDWTVARYHPQLAASPRADGMLPMAAASDFEHQDATVIPDWALHWIRSLHNLWRWTGDRDLVGELLVPAEGVLRWYDRWRGDDGLVHDVSGWNLVDWSSVYTTGCSSVVNALWARALEDVADLAAWLGDAGREVWARERYEAVRAAFDVFWDERRGVYVDHVVDGVVRPVAAQHAGAAALAAGLVPADRVDRVVERLVDRTRLIRHSWVMDTVTPEGGSTGFLYLVQGYPEPVWDVEERHVECQPFFRYVLHDGLARNGHAHRLAELCRDWGELLDRGDASWPECWVGGTHCHGWSATPTRDLVWYVLGVQPAEPGWGRVRVAPALGDLAWARGTVPTPHGPVTVEARADGTVTVDSPVPYEVVPDAVSSAAPRGGPASS